MAETMQFDLVSPERRLASAQVTEVRIPGADGDMTAMPGHAALITTLRPGILTVVSAAGTTDYAVTGGFAEITADQVTVLAERGLPKAEVTPALHAQLVAEARAARDAAPQNLVDDAIKLLADMEALGTHIGL
ncbi:MAG: ATP synthase F1 subunit epsilon [Alphaproteobacteria bacterium HGW-Alphaproteobacteria-5]|nr:MAG: ATP synthase F1 subunit epsilon [Alphaproteobacteria bacterium HGW-Alphaproteobacteria-5]